MSTAIQWCDETWNIVTGCTKVSPGCAFCYIERTPPFRIEGRRFVNGATGVRLHPERLDIPLRWRKPRRIFVNSLSDLFHEEVPDEFIDRVFATMAICGAQRQTCKAGTRCQHDEERGCWMQGDGRELPIHTFQVLTKRPERMRAYLSDQDRFQRIVDVGNDPEWHMRWEEPEDMIDGVGWPLPNVWLGVSVENQRMADERIPLLLETPAAVRFLSVEPLLGPVDLRPYISRLYHGGIPGLKAGGKLLPPSATGKSTLLKIAQELEPDGPQRSDKVYLTSDPAAARMFAQLYPNGYVYRTFPSQPLEDDPDCDEPGLSYQCPSATVAGSHAKVDWCIAGGESGGPEHRRLVEQGYSFSDKSGLYLDERGRTWYPKPVALSWVRSLRDQCVAAGVPFFFKQYGGPKPTSGGRMLDGVTWDEMPQHQAAE